MVPLIIQPFGHVPAAVNQMRESLKAAAFSAISAMGGGIFLVLQFPYRLQPRHRLGCAAIVVCKQIHRLVDAQNRRPTFLFPLLKQLRRVCGKFEKAFLQRQFLQRTSICLLEFPYAAVRDVRPSRFRRRHLLDRSLRPKYPR